MANNFEQIKALVDAGNKMGLSNTITRDYGIPLDYSSVYATYADAVEYAATSTKAYQGQIIAAEGVAYIIVGESQGKLNDVDVYLKAIGTAPVGDSKSITVSAEGVIAIMGLGEAAVGNLPRKAADGTIEWVPVSSVVEGDTNTITLITESEGKTGVSATYNEEATTYTYTINADVSMETANSVITIRQNGVEVGTITLPTAEIEALAAKIGEIEEGETVASLIQKNKAAIELLTENLTTEEIDSVKELVDYVNEHGTEVEGLKTDIANNKKAIEDEVARASGVETNLTGRLDTLESTTVPQVLVDAKAYTDEKIAAIPEVVHPEYAVSKTADDATKTDTYKLTKDGAAIDVSIVVPRAYDDTTLINRIAVDEKALADYKTEMITTLAGKADKSTVDALTATVGGHTTDITGLQQNLSTANTEIGGLKTSVASNTGAIETLQGSVNELIAKDTTIEGRIAGLETKDGELEAAIGVNAENIAKKADATALDNYYTKTAIDGKIGDLGENDNLVALIADAKKAGTDANNAVETLKTTEVKANADAVALLNGEDTGKSVRVIAGEAANDAVATMLADAPEAFDTLKEMADWLNTHSADAIEMDNRIAANEGKLEGIETTVLAAIEAAAYELPTATADALGGVKASEEVSVAADGTLGIAKVSTDVLVNGAEELVLNGGNAG